LLIISDAHVPLAENHAEDESSVPLAVEANVYDSANPSTAKLLI
jgi:hypothetical protein